MLQVFNEELASRESALHFNELTHDNALWESFWVVKVTKMVTVHIQTRKLADKKRIIRQFKINTETHKTAVDE